MAIGYVAAPPGEGPPSQFWDGAHSWIVLAAARVFPDFDAAARAALKSAHAIFGFRICRVRKQGKDWVLDSTTHKE